MRKASLPLTFFICGGIAAAQPTPVPLVGVDRDGKVYHQPPDWPKAAGAWNGKSARFNTATGRIVFETYRADIVGGSEPAPKSKISGVDMAFMAGRNTGKAKPSGTTVLYVARRDGSDAGCIGCVDVIDGVNGQRVFSVDPSTSKTPNAPLRRPGSVIYANRNKDLASWTPDGLWLIASIEMPRHALTHDQGNGGSGLFNDLWAISWDGKTWVQLTDFASTWQMADGFAAMPLPSATSACATGTQYESKQRPTPFHAYFCSAPGAPPPSIGTMRPTVGSANGELVIAWGERVGWDPSYASSGVVQLAMANLKFGEDGVPALVGYKRNLTPTPEHPHLGKPMWQNPDGMAEIGNLYEPWAFSADGTKLALASDVFRSTGTPGVRQALGSGTAAFMDVIEWKWQGMQATLDDVTRYDETMYAYSPNGTPVDKKDHTVKQFGHWEEPATFLTLEGWDFLAFGSSANLSPAWNPLDHDKTFGMETWVIPQDRTTPARKVTSFNLDSGKQRWVAYPTDAEGHDCLLLSVLPAGQPGATAPGTIYRLALAH